MIEQEEARLLFKKWSEDRMPIFCVSALPHFGVIVEGFADPPSDEMFSVFSVDRKSSFTLEWGAGLKFEYCDVSRLPIPTPNKALSIIGVSFPLRVPLPLPATAPRRDVLFFVELDKPDEEDIDT